MLDKKLKYQSFLEKFPACPSENFSNVEIKAFRWVHQPININDFLPLNIIQSPPIRILDNNDLMCIAYGLSMFDSIENACTKYKKQYFSKRKHQ